MYKHNSAYLRPANADSLILKTPVQKKNNISKSLSSSMITQGSLKKGNGVKLPSAYYNDRRKIYMNQSRALSETSITYQSKDISFSERKRYTQ